MNIPALVKADYANLLAILHRVEAKGLAEMHEIVALGAKLKDKVENWVEHELHPSAKANADLQKNLPMPPSK